MAAGFKSRGQCENARTHPPSRLTAVMPDLTVSDTEQV
jgi:hypothetical protein